MSARRLLPLVVIVCVVALEATAQATAGSIKASSSSFKTVKYTGAADGSDLIIDGSKGTVTFTEAGITDPAIGDDPDNVCFQDGPGKVTCTDPTLGMFEARLGAGNDRVIANGSLEWRIYGEEGDDEIRGPQGAAAELDGGPDADILIIRGSAQRVYVSAGARGGPGPDVIRGGPGDDYLDGGAGADDMDGGDGDDSVYGSEDVDVMRGGPGEDNVGGGGGDAGELLEGGDDNDSINCDGDPGDVHDGGAGYDRLSCGGGVQVGQAFVPYSFVIDLAGGTVRRKDLEAGGRVIAIEDVSVSGGDDEIAGTDGTNRLQGGQGNDRIDGRGGSDQLNGSDGDDQIEATDGAQDRIAAGVGNDACAGDDVDETASCETLTVAPRPEPVALEDPPVVKPAADTTGPNCTITRERVTRPRRRIQLSIACDEPALVSIQAIGRVKSLRLVGGATARVRLTPTKRYRRAVRRGKAIRIVLQATDALGNQSALQLTAHPR